MRGFKNLLKILGSGWAASFLVTSSAEFDNPISRFVLTSIRALPIAVVVGVLAWILSDRSRQVSLNSKPVFWTIIVIGVLATAGTYGELRNEGMNVGEAWANCLIGMQGILVVFGIIGLIFGAKKTSEVDNAPNP